MSCAYNKCYIVSFRLIDGSSEILFTWIGEGNTYGAEILRIDEVTINFLDAKIYATSEANDIIYAYGTSEFKWLSEDTTLQTKEKVSGTKVQD